MAVKRDGIIAAIAAAALIATPMVKRWEGRRLVPYHDLVRVLTVCDGETRVPMRRYTDAECDALTTRAIEQDFAPAVLGCTPGVAARPAVFAAAIVLTYNIGTAAYCRSTTARAFNAGDWRAGCDAMLKFHYAGGRSVRGLMLRRRDEHRLCLTGVR